MFCCKSSKLLLALSAGVLLGAAGWEMTAPRGSELSNLLFNCPSCQPRSPACPINSPGTSLHVPCCNTAEDGEEHTSCPAAGACPADAACPAEQATPAEDNPPLATGRRFKTSGTIDVMATTSAQEEPAAAVASAVPVAVTNPVASSAVVAEAGFGGIRGRVVFSGELPKPETEKVDKDQAHCLEKGPVPNWSWKINPANKGVAGVVVFLRPEKGQSLPVHDSLKPTPAPVVVDQPFCQFVPRVVAIRADQKIIFKNPAPVAHNVVINGANNAQNKQMAPGAGDLTLELQPAYTANAISCGAHPWMKGAVWCFEHPYFAVTNEDGEFEIKHAPAGTRQVVLWHENRGWLAGKNGKKVDVPDGAPIDLGVIELKAD